VHIPEFIKHRLEQPGHEQKSLAAATQVTESSIVYSDPRK
jgi:hypothetical protein